MTTLRIYFHDGREPVTINDAMDCEVKNGTLTITHWNGGFVAYYEVNFNKIAEIHVDPKEKRK